MADEEKKEETHESSSGYEPPSYGYQPPSYEPDFSTDAAENDEPKPKKKSFMDDDDDDIPSLRPAEQKKSRAEIDRENQEMFRKAAEEDGKYAEHPRVKHEANTIQPNGLLHSNRRRRAGASADGLAGARRPRARLLVK
jgi:hypothetical protein